MFLRSCKLSLKRTSALNEERQLRNSDVSKRSDETRGSRDAETLQAATSILLILSLKKSKRRRQDYTIRLWVMYADSRQQVSSGLSLSMECNTSIYIPTACENSRLGAGKGYKAQPAREVYLRNPPFIYRKVFFLLHILQQTSMLNNRSRSTPCWHRFIISALTFHPFSSTPGNPPMDLKFPNEKTDFQTDAEDPG